MRKFIVLLAGVGLMAVAACNTVDGVGEDVSAAGDAVSGAAEDVRN